MTYEEYYERWKNYYFVICSNGEEVHQVVGPIDTIENATKECEVNCGMGAHKIHSGPINFFRFWATPTYTLDPPGLVWQWVDDLLACKTYMESLISPEGMEPAFS